VCSQEWKRTHSTQKFAEMPRMICIPCLLDIPQFFFSSEVALASFSISSSPRPFLRYKCIHICKQSSEGGWTIWQVRVRVAYRRSSLVILVVPSVVNIVPLAGWRAPNIYGHNLVGRCWAKYGENLLGYLCTGDNLIGRKRGSDEVCGVGGCSNRRGCCFEGDVFWDGCMVRELY
jgi:hypothetical protein